jgi:hypothetical protein
MEVNKFYCETCVEFTLYTTVKPRFCSACGQPFAVFGAAPKTVKQIVAEIEKTPTPSWGNLKGASYYRNKEKAKFVEEDPDDDDLEEEGDDFQGDPNYVPGSIKEVSFDGIFGNSGKKNKGVSLADIIGSETVDNDKPVKSKKPRGRKKK